MTQLAKMQDAAKANAVRPFRINVPDAAFVDLRRRVAATRWPDRETVADQSQACGWRRSRRSYATGGRTTTGGRWGRG
jgi:hypothetical protein